MTRIVWTPETRNLAMLPGNKARSIIVEDRTYRWLVSPATCRLLVEDAAGEGGRLEVELIRELDGWYFLPGAVEPEAICGPITPERVAAAIRAGRRLGWLSDGSRAPVRIPKAEPA